MNVQCQSAGAREALDEAEVVSLHFAHFVVSCHGNYMLSFLMFSFEQFDFISTFHAARSHCHQMPG